MAEPNKQVKDEELQTTARVEDGDDNNTTNKPTTPIDHFNIWEERLCLCIVYVAVPVLLIGTFWGASQAHHVVGQLDLTQPVPNNTCLNVYHWSNLSNRWQVWLCCIPFLIVFWGVLGLNLSSVKVSPIATCITAALGLLYFGDYGELAGENLVTICGAVLLVVVDRVVWVVFQYVYPVATAFFFLRVLQLWGVMSTMKDEFERLADDPERLIILIQFCFAIALALVAPGGSNFLISGTLLMEMNLMRLPEGPEKDKYDIRIGGLCLFGNAVTSAFNLVGVCVIAMAGDLLPMIEKAGVSRPCGLGDEKCAQKQIGFHFSAQIFLLCMFTPMWWVGMFTRRGMFPFTWYFVKRNLILSLGVGFFFSLGQILTARYIGPELPCLAAGAFGTAFYLFWVKLVEPCLSKRINIPPATYSEVAQRPAKPITFERFRFTLPFVLLCILLLIINLSQDVTTALEGGLVDVQAQQALNFYMLSVYTTCLTLKERWEWFVHSGTMVIWCAVFTPMMVPFREQTQSEVDAIVGSVDLNPGLTRGHEFRFGNHIPTPAEATFLYVQESMRSVKTALLNLGHPNMIFWSRYKTVMKQAAFDALNEATPVAIAIAGYASIAKLMYMFGMTGILAYNITETLAGSPNAFGIVAVLVGSVGSMLTGSTTTSNFLFGRMQVQTAINLGIVTPTNTGSAWAVAGAQMLGSSIGELIAPQNAIFSVMLLRGRFRDSQVIKEVLPFSALCWAVICAVTGVVALGTGMDYGFEPSAIVNGTMV